MRLAFILSGAVFFLMCNPIIADAASKSNLINPPDDFPKFIVGGYESDMASARALFYLHFAQPAQHATFWDPWLPKSLLWPAGGSDFAGRRARDFYKRILLNRHIDQEGYVSTEQHLGLAHHHGWPFPTWQQAQGIGWHFVLEGMPYKSAFHMTETADVSDWTLSGARTVGLCPERGWSISLTEPAAAIQTPAFSVSAHVAPFIRLEWKQKDLPASANPYIEWTTQDQPNFDPSRRMYFSAPSAPDAAEFTMIPVYRSPHWKGRITGLRFCFDNASEATIVILSLITAVDSRHNINNAVFIQASYDYFCWTQDLDFLRRNIGRMRQALAFALKEFELDKRYYVVTPWVGHDGSSGLERHSDGSRTIRYGNGIGNNYWDLLPFGGKDALATIYYYDAILKLAVLEKYIAANPELNIPQSAGAFCPIRLEQLAAQIKKTAGSLFWNPQTGRFVSAIDLEGKAYDYGFTFVNLEAIYYDFANADQKRQILEWLDGKRIIASDTSVGADIYHWRFAPRATTKRNIEYYNFAWNQPEILNFGDQVQDGGAVLGFSYFDLMSRLKVNGADDAWKRFKEILAWFNEAQAEGGYRSYYSKPGRGTLQGGGTAGGLGMDCEFFESALLPQAMLYGFLGFKPVPGGFEIKPSLPADWPSLAIDQIAFADGVLSVAAKPGKIIVKCVKMPTRPMHIQAVLGDCLVRYLDSAGVEIASQRILDGSKANIPLQKERSATVELIR